MEKGDLSEKSEHRACMHDHTWLRLAKSPNSMLQQPSLLQRLRYGAATRKMRDRYGARALWRRWCVRRRGRRGTDGARGLGFDACCECLQISSSPTLRGAQSRCKPRHNRRACAQRASSLVVSLPGFRVDGVQEDAMTTAALAEKGQVGFAKLMRWLDGSRVSVLYLGQARTARFALIDLEPG